MRFLRTIIFASLVAFCAPTARAQFGLYGSPQMLNLPPGQPAMVPYGGYATPPGYPGTVAGPVRQAVPAAAYAPPPKPSLSQRGSPAADTASPASNLVEQMLHEPGGGGSPDCHHDSGGSRCAGGGATQDRCGGCLETVNDYEQAACGFDEYGCAPGPRSPWFASVSGLIMGRNEPNRVWVTYETGNEPNQLMNTQDVGLKWRGGGEIRFGRRFCCDRWALEATYWTLDLFSGLASQTHLSGVSTPLTISGIEFANPSPPPSFLNGTAFFDSADEHRLWRRNEFHSVELNFVRHHVQATSYQPWDLDWTAGVRFFRFEENLIFGTLTNSGTWGGNGGVDEAYLHDRIENNLVGFQFGFDAGYHLLRRCRLFVTPKFGIYNNQIDHLFRAYLGDGTVAQPTAASGQTGSFPVRSEEDTLSFLTQIDLGVDWQFARRWSARVGYRVVVATGIGLADNQIPPFIVDIPEIADIDENGELVLHGAVAGVTYNF